MVRIHDLQTGTDRAFSGHESSSHVLVFTPDGRELASSGWDGTIRVWDVASGEAMVLRGHAAKVRALAISPDGNWLASGTADRLVCVWNLRTGEHREAVVFNVFYLEKARMDLP